jgi:autotransporter-associated beta strand protein
MRTAVSGWVLGGRILTIALISSVITVAAAGRAHADTRTFIGTVGGLWSVNSNWSPAGPLETDDDLVFPLAGAGTSVNDYPGTLTVNSIAFEGDHALSGGTIALTGFLSATPFITVGLTTSFSLSADQTWTIGSGSSVTLNSSVSLGNRQWTVDAELNAGLAAHGISGTGAIIKIGPGDLRLPNQNTFNGPVAIGAGSISIEHANSLGFHDGTADHATTVHAGARLRVNGPATLPEALILNGSGGASLSLDSLVALLDVTGPVTLTSRSAIGAISNGIISFHAPVAGPGALEIRDATIVGLMSAGSDFPAVYFSGAAGGMLRSLGVDAIPLNLAVDLPAGSLLDLNGSHAQLSSLTGDGTVQIAGAGVILTVSVAAATTQVFNGVIDGAGQVVKTGAGELVLGGASTFTGETRVLQGRLRIAHPEALGPAGGSANSGVRVRGNATFMIDGVSPVAEYITVESVAPGDTPVLEINGSAPVTLSSPLQLQAGAIVRGTGASVTSGELYVFGAATLENVIVHLTTAANQIFDALTIGAGAALHADVADVLPVGTQIAIANTGTLALNGHAAALDRLTGTGTVSLGTGGALEIRAFTPYTFAGTIAGSGSFTKTANADFTLAGPTPFTGTATVSGGRLIVAHAYALASHAITVYGTLVYDVTASPTGPITLNGTGPLNNTEALYVRGGNVTFSGAVTVPGAPAISRLRVDAPHTLTLLAPISGYWLSATGSGTTVIGSGGNTLQNLEAGSLVSNAPTGGSVRVNAADAFSAALALRVQTGATFDLNGFTQTVGVLSGPGRVELGKGALTLASTSGTAFNGTFSGTGDFVANVPFIQMQGTHTLTGSVTVNGGFTFGGTLPAAITVNTPGFYSATLRPGTVVGPITVNGENWLIVGDQTTPGGVTVGGLTLGGHAGLLAYMHGTGVPLTVNGQVSLNGGGINPTPANGFTFTRGAPVMVIANDEADVVAGNFANAPEGASLFSASGALTITYVGGTGNDVSLVMPQPGYHLSEGATGPFFDTELLIANPNDASVTVDVTLMPEGGEPVTRPYTLPALSRLTILADEIPGFEHVSFSTVVRPTTDVPLVVERTMRWGAGGYGAHTEKATLETEGLGWLSGFAEGAEGFFHTFLLLENPQLTKNTAFVTYLRENETPIMRTYDLEPRSRRTIVAGEDPELVNRSFGITVLFAMPATAERAMYFGDDPIWTGGHASAGARGGSMTWFLAEGATGGIFDTFILVANPVPDPVDVTYTFLPESGAPAMLTRTIAGFGRLTINPAAENLGIPAGPVATQIIATAPVIAERSQYWSATGGAWNESHNSLGVTAAATKWGLAEGRAGGAEGYQTYILLANPGTSPAHVTLQFLGDGVSAAPANQTIEVGAQQRVTVRVDPSDPSAAAATATTFGATIASDTPIVVERALYWNANGQLWSAGTNATATPLP